MILTIFAVEQDAVDNPASLVALLGEVGDPRNLDRKLAIQQDAEPIQVGLSSCWELH